MICMKCKNEIHDGMPFCSHCGNKVESNVTKDSDVDDKEVEKIKKNGNRSIRNKLILGILVLVIIFIVGVSTYVIRRNENLKNQYNVLFDNIIVHDIVSYDEKVDNIISSWVKLGYMETDEKNELIAELQLVEKETGEIASKIDDYKGKLSTKINEAETLELAEKEYEDYLDAMQVFEDMLRDRKIINIDEFDIQMEIIEEAYDILIQANQSYIDDKMEVYSAINLKTAEATDINDYNSYKEEIENMVSENNFTGVTGIINNLNVIFDKYVEPENSLNIMVQQVDVSNYPKVRLYLDITDNNGDVVKDLDNNMFFVRKKDLNGDYIKEVVKSARQLNEVEALNIDIVADISGSMWGYPLETAKDVMSDFIKSIQFSAGDMIELTSFSDGVYIEQNFTNDEYELLNSVDNLVTQDMTALYDALYTAVNKVASRSGAKCVIAFTDGEDNYSSLEAKDVIKLANRYNVPIFIIGIGNANYTNIRNIANQTGGQYYNVDDVEDIGTIYQEIYRQEKELYILEFEDTSSVALFSESKIVAGYHTKMYGGEIKYSYIPYTLVSVDDTSLYTSGPEGIVASYLKAFADAMSYQDYSYISDYIKNGSSIETEQKKYVLRGISEVLDSYEIENVAYTNSEKCIITTRETYFVQKENSPLSLLTQRCSYLVEKVGSDWKITSFVDKVEVLSRIKY